MSMVLLVSLEGNVGAGKTTAFNVVRRVLQNVPEVAFLPEPVDEWVERGFLRAMYSKELSASTFQQVVLMSLAADLANIFIHNKDCKVVITERSAITNFIFARQNLEGIELEAYNFTFDRFMKLIPPDMIPHHVYLKTTPKIAAERLSARGRPGESQVSLAYLTGLHDLHEKWSAASNVHTVDASDNGAFVEERIWDAIAEIVEDQPSAFYVELYKFVKIARMRSQLTNVVLTEIPAIFGNAHGDRKVCAALLNPDLQLGFTPRQIIETIKEIGLPIGHLWNAFKHSGGITSAEIGNPHECDQLEALRRTWDLVKRSQLSQAAK